MSRHLHLNLRAALVLAAVAMVVAAAPALAADSVYWGNESANTISDAALDGSGGGDLVATGATVNAPFSVAIDAAAGRIYWANHGNATISFANLDGSGGAGTLATGAATVNGPFGIAIDPGAGRIYWANDTGNKISYANLNGTGGGDLATTGATVSTPIGVAIDPAVGRIYWANLGNATISFANLDGSGGGGTLATTGATVSGPEGVAIDPAAGRIYWANYFSAKISFADLNGAGGGDLPTTGATVASPSGVAIDPTAGRIYWANSTSPGGGISFANLNGTGGGNLSTTGATVADPAFPVLLESPRGAGAPTISGGSTLACTQGSWATDLLSDFLYRSAQAYSYSWQLNGAAIAGASGHTLTPAKPGLYSCRVTATNHAGSGAQTSAKVLVAAVISDVTETKKIWREGKKFATISRKRPAVGTTFKFRLNTAAAVRFDFTQPARGRKVHGRCVAQNKHNKHKQKCVRTVSRATLSFTGHAGVNTIHFEGRISRTKKLKRGRYTLVISAITPGFGSTAKKLTFTIVK